MSAGRHWSDEDYQYLEDNWGVKSIKAIAKDLGRTINSIKIKAQRRGLIRNTFCMDVITVNQLACAVGVSPSYTVKDLWIDKLELPCTKRTMCEKRKMTFINVDDFWKWAKKHKREINFSRFEENMLGVEPDWVKKKRKADLDNMTYKKINVPWTPIEEETLKVMLKAFKYTYSDISKALNRTEGAIKRRIEDLELKERPVKTEDHKKWTAEEIAILVEMYHDGYGNNSIGDKVGKTARAVEGKIERMKKGGLL